MLSKAPSSLQLIFRISNLKPRWMRTVTAKDLFSKGNKAGHPQISTQSQRGRDRKHKAKINSIIYVKVNIEIEEEPMFKVMLKVTVYSQSK